MKKKLRAQMTVKLDEVVSVALPRMDDLAEVRQREAIEVAERRSKFRLRGVRHQYEANKRCNRRELQECTAQARIDVFREIYSELNKVLMTRLVLKLSRFDQARARLSRNRVKSKPSEESSQYSSTRDLKDSSPPPDLTTPYPYIVYRLTPQQIDEDLSVIREARAASTDVDCSATGDV